jgi:DNA invertase Pin-like site-specific DNA recombinase
MGARRAVILARVSRGGRTQTPESQVLALRAAAQRLGWEVVEPPLSITTSAWTEEGAADVRRQALKPIEDGHADTLMIWSLDRLVRGGIEAAFGFVRHLEEHLGAHLWSAQEPFLSTAGTDRQTRELLLSLLAWVAKWESQRKSERLRARVAEKRATAGKLGQRARWGRGVSATAPEVAKVHELRAQGKTVRAIGADLGLSKSQVSTILRVRPRAEGQNEAADGAGHAPGPRQD